MFHRLARDDELLRQDRRTVPSDVGDVSCLSGGSGDGGDGPHVHDAVPLGGGVGGLALHVKIPLQLSGGACPEEFIVDWYLKQGGFVRLGIVGAAGAVVVYLVNEATGALGGDVGLACGQARARDKADARDKDVKAGGVGADDVYGGDGRQGDAGGRAHGDGDGFQ